MATHSSILAWRIPWTEEPGGLQSMGSPLRPLRGLQETRVATREESGAPESTVEPEGVSAYLEKEMATHSSVLAWRIPGTGEPGGLPSMGLHSVFFLTKLLGEERDDRG